MSTENLPAATEEHAPKKSKGTFWMLLPLILLVTSVSGWLTMVSIAVDDPGFSVESDYYKKAANFDEELEQRAENERLGWTVEAVAFTWLRNQKARLTLRVSDAKGQDIAADEAVVLAFPVARGKKATEAVLESVGDGIFIATFEKARPGLWEVRVRVRQGEQSFTQKLRPELPVLVGTRSGGPPS